MSDLVVLAFDTETGATEMRDDLIRLQKQKIVELEDAASLSGNRMAKSRLSKRSAWWAKAR